MHEPQALTALKHIFRQVEKSEYRHTADGITALVLLLSGANNIVTGWRVISGDACSRIYRGQGPKCIQFPSTNGSAKTCQYLLLNRDGRIHRYSVYFCVKCLQDIKLCGKYNSVFCTAKPNFNSSIKNP